MCLFYIIFVIIWILKVESPTFVGKSKPIPATPSPSDQVVTYVPTKKLVTIIYTIICRTICEIEYECCLAGFEKTQKRRIHQ